MLHHYLSDALKTAISNNDLDTIKTARIGRPAATRRDELDECLAAAMPQAFLETIEYIIQLGPRLNESAFRHAIERGPEVLQLLLDGGWDIDSTEFEIPPIQFVLGRTPVLIWMLEHGADPNTKSVRAYNSCLQTTTPLCEAARLSEATAFLILPSHGAEMEPEAIFHAIARPRSRNNGTATLRALIEHGADVNHVSKNWVTPLYHAVRWTQVEETRFLLDAGADPRVTYPDRDITALSRAKEMDRMDLWAMMRASYSSATD